LTADVIIETTVTSTIIITIKSKRPKVSFIKMLNVNESIREERQIIVKIIYDI
jgi:hypothetical protein